jgi:hypothetical protein
MAEPTQTVGFVYVEKEERIKLYLLPSSRTTTLNPLSDTLHVIKVFIAKQGLQLSFFIRNE